MQTATPPHEQTNEQPGEQEVECTEVPDRELSDLAILVRDAVEQRNLRVARSALGRAAEIGADLPASCVARCSNDQLVTLAKKLCASFDIQINPAAFLTREQRRSKRKRAVRARTESMKRITKREIDLGAMVYTKEEHPFAGAGRPRNRTECRALIRPCPFVSCQHHLYLDVNPRTGAIKLNFPDLEPDQMKESCVLDIADRGGATLEEVGAYVNLTRERVRQIEIEAMGQVIAGDTDALRDFLDDEDGRPRHRLRVLPAVTAEPPCSAEDDENEENEEELDDGEPALDAYDDESCFDHEPFNAVDAGPF